MLFWFSSVLECVDGTILMRKWPKGHVLTRSRLFWDRLEFRNGIWKVKVGKSEV